MSNLIFRENQIICFQTNYFKERHDLTGYQYYLLKEIDENDGLLIFFPIISDRSKEWTFYSQYKIENRPPCLDNKIYPESFVNINCLIKVPINSTKFLERNCKDVHQNCLDKEEFKKILELHNSVVEFQEILRTDVETIKLIEKSFIF